MWILFILFIFIAIVINEYINSLELQQKYKEKQQKYYNMEKYTTNNYVMTQTELIFYRELKKITDKYNIIIFPQVDMERIVKVVDNNPSDRNKIKSRSIDYTLVNNINCKILACIELDDISHKNPKAFKVDKLKDEIFKKIKIPLYRIEVKNTYNLDDLDKIIKEL